MLTSSERMKKLVIQIPCFNEETTLPITLSVLPRQVPGVDVVEWLVIDDGSTDQTLEVAQKSGVDHIVNFSKNRGLAKAFMAGLQAALQAGADIIVNIDADNQYCADDIPKLISPILAGKAEIVIGSRPIDQIHHFSTIKKYLQKLGSWVVRRVSQTEVPDATSGFRAFSRNAARALNVFSDYTYTLETIIQAGQKGMAIASVPIRTNQDLRKSRLVKSIPSYVAKSMGTIFRIFVVYKPFDFFIFLGVFLFSMGTAIGLRFLYYYLTIGGMGHIQSLILASILIGIGFQTIMVAFVADLLAVNRKLLEELQYKARIVNNGTKKSDL
jgi:glycosyltransferase involved in cell wall biosynthesis